jgi:hypothetical protein
VCLFRFVKFLIAGYKLPFVHFGQSSGKTIGIRHFPGCLKPGGFLGYGQIGINNSFLLNSSEK